MKLLLWLVLILIVLHLLRRNKGKPPTVHDVRPSDGATAELMVRCEHCGIYLPQSEAVSGSRGVAYCSAAHRALHPPT